MTTATIVAPSLEDAIASNARDIAILVLQNVGYPKRLAEQMIDSDPAALELFTVLAREHARRVLDTQAAPTITIDPLNDSPEAFAAAAGGQPVQLTSTGAAYDPLKAL